MAYTDILNPKKGFDPALGDSMCPNYGFDRDRPSTLVTAKPRGGHPSFREVDNSGHTFTFSWLGRTRKCVQRIRQIAEQSERGCFTVIDWDNGGRHYVGRFTSIPKVTQAAFGKFNIQGATFEEVPGMAMVQYPSNWDHDAINLNVSDDFGAIQAATNGTNWTIGAYTVDGDDALSAQTTYVNAGAANEWLQMDYRGYGFAVQMLQGRACGQVQVYLDGALQTPVDENGNALAAAIDLYADQDDALGTIFLRSDVPLDLHRVKVVVLGSRNGASASNAASFVRLKVMR